MKEKGDRSNDFRLPVVIAELFMEKV